MYTLAHNGLGIPDIYWVTPLFWSTYDTVAAAVLAKHVLERGRLRVPQAARVYVVQREANNARVLLLLYCLHAPVLLDAVVSPTHYRSSIYW